MQFLADVIHVSPDEFALIYRDICQSDNNNLKMKLGRLTNGGVSYGIFIPFVEKDFNIAYKDKPFDQLIDMFCHNKFDTSKKYYTINTRTGKAESSQGIKTYSSLKIATDFARLLTTTASEKQIDQLIYDRFE